MQSHFRICNLLLNCSIDSTFAPTSLICGQGCLRKEREKDSF